MWGKIPDYYVSLGQLLFKPNPHFRVVVKKYSVLMFVEEEQGNMC